MIESNTRSILRSGDSRGVALSPKWLQRYKPKRFYVIHLNGFVLVFPFEQTSHLEKAFGETVAEVVREVITKKSHSVDQEVGFSESSGEPD